MTVVVTRDVADRYRGFLSSIMPEAAPGVFVGAELSKGVRERLWTVLSDWWPPRPPHPGPAAPNPFRSRRRAPASPLTPLFDIVNDSRYLAGRGSPAHAGMDPFCALACSTRPGLPRPRGG
ncbi:type I-E CRISPR-associated endoribonuclease Cas2e [Enterovirga sp. DB1703]|uniref:type I-E CRISPR-associated endoribonuclease Cas2e n=1 Tax=Enterovirga aerilata TaxID=2730920 RepID=UPI001AED27E6